MNTISIPAWLSILQLPGTLFVGAILLGFYVVGQRDKRYTSASWVAITFIVVWYSILLWLGTLNIFEIRSDGPPLLPIPVSLGMIVPIILFMMVGPLRALIAAMPLTWLVGVQAFRIMGGVFLLLYLTGDLPAEFGIPAGIGDLIVGITALPLANMIRKQHPAALSLTVVWAIFGIADHVTALIMGILTSPGAFEALVPFGGTNQITTLWPLIMFPIFRVPIGIVINILVLQKVRQLRRSPASELAGEPRMAVHAGR